MKNAPKETRSEMKPDYDFSSGVRGKYAKRFAEGTNVVVLEPDIMRAFPDSAAVNHALRLFIETAKRARRAG